LLTVFPDTQEAVVLIWLCAYPKMFVVELRAAGTFRAGLSGSALRRVTAKSSVDEGFVTSAQAQVALRRA